MDLSLESSLRALASDSQVPGQLAGRPLEDWNAAYARVQCYFHALGVRNQILLGRWVLHVLQRAMQRSPKEPERSAIELAADETDRVVTEWFGQVLQEPSSGPGHLLSTRGRLALLLADMPGKWQDQFLGPGPWPKEFVAAMRETYLRAGPDFQLSQMAPRPLDRGPITTLTNISRLPYTKMVVIWVIFAVVLVAIFLLTH